MKEVEDGGDPGVQQVHPQEKDANQSSNSIPQHPPQEIDAMDIDEPQK